jgi:hypothetical protein
MANESARTRAWCAKLEAAGASVLPVVAGMRGRSGWPDRFVAYAHPTSLIGVSGSVWLEFKTEHGELSPAQIAVMQKLHANGQRAYVARHMGPSLKIEDLYGNWVHTCKTTKDLLQFICPCSRDISPPE